MTYHGRLTTEGPPTLVTSRGQSHKRPHRGQLMTDSKSSRNQYTHPVIFSQSFNIDTATGCWMWSRARTSKNYGTLSIGGRMTLAHRHSWFLANGPIPRGICVLHRCDVTLCVNPSHLFLGTHQDNMRDMHEKGRNRNGDPSGERNSQSKLTDDAVRDIRARVEQGELQTSVAESFGVNPPTINKVVHRKSWNHVK